MPCILDPVELLETFQDARYERQRPLRHSTRLRPSIVVPSDIDRDVWNWVKSRIGTQGIGGVSLARMFDYFAHAPTTLPRIRRGIARLQEGRRKERQVLIAVLFNHREDFTVIRPFDRGRQFYTLDADVVAVANAVAVEERQGNGAGPHRPAGLNAMADLQVFWDRYPHITEEQMHEVVTIVAACRRLTFVRQTLAEMADNAQAQN